ncbi:hypothetical protein DFJ63DRAFT_337082 [Scheffersomyces coipomensis]|uniref:uncharacterized protein n=1 Tax=Scheffersomyces coipomensis TaxID=1788519 RepID=UPI00315D73AC
MNYQIPKNQSGSSFQLFTIINQSNIEISSINHVRDEESAFPNQLDQEESFTETGTEPDSHHSEHLDLFHKFMINQVRQSGVNLRPPIIPLHHPLEELTEIREPKFKIDWIFVVVFSPFMGLLLGTLCYNVTGYYDGFGSFISLLATLSFGLLALGFWFVAIQKPHEVVFENHMGLSDNIDKVDQEESISPALFPTLDQVAQSFTRVRDIPWDIELVIGLTAGLLCWLLFYGYTGVYDRYALVVCIMSILWFGIMALCLGQDAYNRFRKLDKGSLAEFRFISSLFIIFSIIFHYSLVVTSRLNWTEVVNQ